MAKSNRTHTGSDEGTLTETVCKEISLVALVAKPVHISLEFPLQLLGIMSNPTGITKDPFPISALHVA